MSDSHEQHITPLPIYYSIYMVLLALTGLTVLVSEIKMTLAWGIIVAMAIASVKATMVVLWFMHVKFEVKPIYIVIGVPTILTLVLVLGLSPDIAAVTS